MIAYMARRIAPKTAASRVTPGLVIVATDPEWDKTFPRTIRAYRLYRENAG